MKRIIALFLVLCISITILGACSDKKTPEASPTPATSVTTTPTPESPLPTEPKDPWDDTATPEDAFVFSNGVITEYIGQYEIVRVPRRIGGVDVVAIGAGAFEKNKIITELYLHPNVKRIENDAFNWAEKLSIAELGMVETIGDNAFNMTRLVSVIISPVCKTIGNKAFHLNTMADNEKPMIEVVIPASVTFIGDDAFNSSRFKTIEFAGVTMPEMGARSLVGLGNVDKIIVQDAYTEAEALELVATLHAAGLYHNVIIERVGGKALFADYSADFEYDFVGGRGARINNYIGSSENVIIPATMGGKPVFEIGENAFEGNETLRSVVLPDGLEVIYGYAFRYCTNLEKINIPDSVYVIGSEAFNGTTSLKSVTLPKGIEELEYAIFKDSGLESVIIQAGPTIIGSSAFLGCKNLRNITIADTVTEIGYNAFGDCISLEAIDFLPSSLREIGQGAFDGCYSVGEIRIPEGVTHIGNLAFSSCGTMEQYRSEWDRLEANYIYPSTDPKADFGDNWVQDDRLTKFVNVYFASTIEYMGYGVFASMWIDGLYLPDGMREVSQLPEFEDTFFRLRYILFVYLDDGATEDQINAMDQFFIEIEEVGDACWWYEGYHPYYVKELVG